MDIKIFIFIRIQKENSQINDKHEVNNFKKASKFEQRTNKRIKLPFGTDNNQLRTSFLQEVDH